MSKDLEDGVDWRVSLLKLCVALVDAEVIDSYVLGSEDGVPTVAWIRSGDRYVKFDISLEKVIDSSIDN